MKSRRRLGLIPPTIVCHDVDPTSLHLERDVYALNPPWLVEPGAPNSLQHFRPGDAKGHFRCAYIDPVLKPPCTVIMDLRAGGFTRNVSLCRLDSFGLDGQWVVVHFTIPAEPIVERVL